MRFSGHRARGCRRGSHVICVSPLWHHLAMNMAKWRKSRSTCSCGWTGINGEIELVETYDAVFEYFCPSCFTKLGVQPYDPYEAPETKAGDAE